ncbi:hypothetical protein DFH09DRAFT_1344127 [Mycena vulgaris]|nr:hypothetical protein DFH09DRAFT_1344127 [Mycena vulgaris]
MDPANIPLERIDVNALLVANTDLVARLGNMQLGYEQQAEEFKFSLQKEYNAVQGERDAARAENQRLASQIAETVARLERMERANAAARPDIDMVEANSGPKQHTPTRDPRVRPAATRDPRSKPQAAGTSGNQTSSHNLPPSTTPERISEPPPPASNHRPSGNPSTSTPSPRTKSPPRSAPSRSRSAPNSSAPSTPSPANKAKPSTRTPRKPSEHQMLRGEVDKAAESFKITFQLHLRFIGGCLDSASAPKSATPDVVTEFQHRFHGLTVMDLKRTGQIGNDIIDPDSVQVGLNIEQVIRSKNKIIAAFFKLEESALIHVRTYLAKLGIYAWAPDYSQTPYSMYNMAMRMCAIDTFRYLVTGTYYDFLRPNTSFLKDATLLTRMYDHFIHHYMWGNEIAAARNSASQSRIRLHNSRSKYLEGAAAPAGVKSMFSLKSTSDDESTPKGVQALARQERSYDADRLIRTVDTLIVEELLQDGKKRAATNRQRRLVSAFGQRNPSRFLEVPKGMPIQYYDVGWYNNRPPQARKKLDAKLVVAFVPGCSDFFSRRSDNVLGVKALTEKYGDQVFGAYDLDYGNPEPDTEASGVSQGPAAGSDDEGESVGRSSDSDADQSGAESEIGSIKSFISDDEGAPGGDFQGSGSEEDNADYSSIGSDDEEGREAAFASAYDVSSMDLDDQQKIFDGPDSDDD